MAFQLGVFREFILANFTCHSWLRGTKVITRLTIRILAFKTLTPDVVVLVVAGFASGALPNK